MKMYVVIFAIMGVSFGKDLEQHDGTERSCTPTSPDVLGPYYYPDAPHRPQLCERDPTFHHVIHLLVQGRVLDEKCKGIPDATLEVWQADHDGHYLFRQKCRGHLYTGPTGGYVFMSIHPGKYTVAPDTNLFRPAHIHFMVRKPGYKTLVTQMYFQGDSNLGLNDSCTTCSSSHDDLVVNPEIICADATNNHCYASVTFDIVLKEGKGYWVVKDTDDQTVELYDLIERG